MKLEGVAARFLSMHKPKRSFHGLIVVANHGRRPIGFSKEEIFGVKELHELKKVELVAMKSSIANVWNKSSILKQR